LIGPREPIIRLNPTVRQTPRTQAFSAAERTAAIFPLLSEEGWLRALFARSRGGVLNVGYTIYLASSY
jgi:hypothetical protein